MASMTRAWSNWFAAVGKPSTEGRARRRRNREIELLEDRLVLSTFAGGHHGHGPGFDPNSPAAQQLKTDVQKLQTDTQAINAKSNVTIGELTALGKDLQQIRATGFRVDRTALNQFNTDLITDVAAGTYTTNASTLQTEFNNLFTGSTVSSTLITQTYNDAVTIAQATNITTDDLNTLKADQAAIASDLATLQSSNGSTGSGTGSTGSGTGSNDNDSDDNTTTTGTTSSNSGSSSGSTGSDSGSTAPITGLPTSSGTPSIPGTTTKAVHVSTNGSVPKVGRHARRHR